MKELNLKVLLLEAGFNSQQEYADAIGVARQSVNTWVSRNKIPPQRLGDIVELVEMAHHETGKYRTELEQLDTLKGLFY